MEDDQEAFSAWQESHKLNCRLNYSGSAPSMEPAGAKRIFERSIEKRGVRYMSFYGDRDSKAYKEVENVYGEEKVTKHQCIGHYQKRVGSLLRKLKKREKGPRDLTEAIIDKLQNYFGIALRSNLSTVENMANAIWASFFHVASSEENNFHSYCAKSAASWCQYQRDQVNKTNLYKPGKGLSTNVIKCVKPIYLDLIIPDELKKCLHGKIQNQNESFNAMIWERVPKITYCPNDRLELAVYDASANFNEGRQATIDILKDLNINPGYHTTVMCYDLNKRRKYSAVYKYKPSSKTTRKVIRANRKKKIDKHNK